MEEKNQHLLQPLLQRTTTNSVENDYKITSSSNASIILRLVLVIFVGAVSLWSNYEASKGFAITIVNEANDQSTFASKRFNLFFVSNDDATRLVLKTSKFVENILYPISDRDSDQPLIKKQVKHVSLQLSSRNLTRPIIVKSSQHDDEFVLLISPSILEGPNYKHDMFLALQKGLARIWLWDGQGNAPSNLVNGMIDYITSLASSSGRVTSESEPVKSVQALGRRCWKSKDTRTIVKLLNYSEGRREGFVRRLNKEMKNGWHEKMIDDALGMPAWHLCVTYNKEVF